ncbi:unnamed protein product [Phytophthora fragariaefolia]|uniref:Unnamed protein product n=1 Tax=Phytophthora fragariaefolia TaxID=1490495 RepID=A0A9W6Y4F0_9STRA|nr:unnamed protein product [Phytophthora fragariaefolia]
MPHHAGVDLILGTDFMIPAGIRLDLYYSTARLPDEVEIPLVKSRSAWLTEPTYGDRADWLARQPPAVERRQYAVPKDVMKRSPRRVDNGEAELTCAQLHELLERAAAASAESVNGRPEAAVTSTNSAGNGPPKAETTESTADDSVRYEPAESAGDDPASSVQAVATSCELTDCDIAESAVAAQTDAAEWDDGPTAGAAHLSRPGVTVLDAKAPDQASEREHLSRVDSAQHETAELKGALRTARELSAELPANSKKGSSVREAIDSLLSDEIEVSDVALADDPEEDLQLRFVAAMAMCEDETTTAVANSATDPAEFKCPANEIDLDERAIESTFGPDMNLPRDFVGHVLSFDGSAMSTKNDGYGSCSWILWRLPSWDIEIAASAHLLATTVDIAESTGMKNGVKAALERDVTDLIIVGDSQLVIHNSMGAIACKEDTQMAHHKKLTDQLSSVRYQHVLVDITQQPTCLPQKRSRTRWVVWCSVVTEKLSSRSYTEYLKSFRFEKKTKADPAKHNQKSEQHKDAPVLSCSEAERLELESPGASSRVRRVEGQAEASANESRVPDSVNSDPAVVRAGRRRRISKTQDEVVRWADRKTLLVREPDDFAHRRDNKASEMTDDFERSELDMGSDKYEVEVIFDDKLRISTSTSRAQHLFKLK